MAQHHGIEEREHGSHTHDSGDTGGNGMGDTPYSAGEELRQSGRESPVKAFLHLILIGAVCLGAAGWYWFRVQDSVTINKLIGPAKEKTDPTGARDFQKADDFVSLKKALDYYMQALAIREDPRAIAGVASVTASLWGMHGLTEMKTEAEKYVKMAVEADVPNGDRFAAEGYLKIFNGDPVGAENDLRQVLARGASDPKILHAVGLALMVQGKTREARVAFGKAIDLSAGEARYSVANAEAYMRDGEYSNAFTFFSRAAIANAEHDRARIGKILAKTKQGGKYDVLAQEIAEILQESAEKLSPADRVFAEYTSAEIALAQGDLDNARKFVESALGHDAKDARLHYLKGHLLAAADKLDEALKSFDQSVELDPYTAAYYFDVAELLRDKGRPSDAVAKLRLYGNKNFQSDEYKKRLGMALVDKGDYTEAEQIFKKMLEVSEYDADALYGLGYCYEMQQKWDEARTNYGTADQYRQGWGDPWYRMGYVAIGEKDYATARDYFDKAIEKYTRVNAPRKQLGRVYLGVATAWEKDGKKRQAESAREKAEKLMR